MPRIHFTSLFGVDLDYDIVSHWSRHYLEMGYDSYTVFLHSVDPKSARYAFVKNTFESAGFEVRQTTSSPYTTQLRNDILEGFARTLDLHDYLCVADSDEFHVIEPGAGRFRDLICSCDVLYGLLVDRWGDSLVEADPHKPLDEQYPNAGDLFQTVFNQSNEAQKDRWRVPNRNKILAARAGLPVAHLGSHVLYNRDSKNKERHGCRVYHFKWRHTIAQRLKTKWYYAQGYERAVLKFFQREKVGA